MKSNIPRKNVMKAVDFPPGTKFFEIDDIPIAKEPGKPAVGLFTGEPRPLSPNTATKLAYEREISPEEFDAYVEKAITYAEEDEQVAAEPLCASILTPEEREELLAACRQVEAERRTEEPEGKCESEPYEQDDEDDDEEGYDPNCYAFHSEDSYPVGNLISAIRHITNRPDLPADTAENLKVFLFAMERLPLVTPGVRMSLGLRLDQGGESDWIEIRMEDGEFTLGRGTWVDGDADTETVFEVTPDYREGDAFAATHFAESFAECASDVCREVVIEDFSDKPFADWDLQQDKSRWNNLPCSFL